MREPFAPTSTLSLSRLVLQADPLVGSNATLHVACGYLTQPPSGGAPVYREAWLQDLDSSPAISGFLQRAAQLVTAIDADFAGAAFNLRAIEISVDESAKTTVEVVYDVIAVGLDLQRRMVIAPPADSFWTRTIATLVAAVQAKLA